MCIEKLFVSASNQTGFDTRFVFFYSGVLGNGAYAYHRLS